MRTFLFQFPIAIIMLDVYVTWNTTITNIVCSSFVDGGSTIYNSSLLLSNDHYSWGKEAGLDHTSEDGFSDLEIKSYNNGEN